MNKAKWPPTFTLDQERILNLLTGDHFYSNPSAALREAVLNAIDAVHRRQKNMPSILPEIKVTFNQSDLTLSVSDNGIGMNESDIIALFSKVGASATATDTTKGSVGEFGIGVISYFMAGDYFDLQTCDGENKPIGLEFSKEMLSGSKARGLTPTKKHQGTTVKIQVRDPNTFDILTKHYRYWFRDVEGLVGVIIPEAKELKQGGSYRADNIVTVDQPEWVERSHLGPVAEPTGWNAMTGKSTVAVLYRGVFVQEFTVNKLWGIEGSIDVDPKHFKPRLNREGFIEGQFQDEVEKFLRECHPVVLESMVKFLNESIDRGLLNKWTEKQWASLWLSVPRNTKYQKAVDKWDDVFRSLPAFELAVGDKWKGISLKQLMRLGDKIYLAPLANDKQTDVIKAALHYLRNTGHHVIRGVGKDKTWLRYAPNMYKTTADLISQVFVSEIPPIIQINKNAENILNEIKPIAPLFTGPPPVDLVRLESNSPPALRLKNRLVINIDNPAGKAIVNDVLQENAGAISLIAATVRHAHQQLTEVAAVVRKITTDPEILSPIRRQHIGKIIS